MDNQITWSLRGATVIAADDALQLMPQGNHQLLISKALDIISRSQDVAVPAIVTAYDIPWPIKAIVEPNNARAPIWGTHALHQTDAVGSHTELSPFVCASRDHRLPMTKALTFEFTGTMNHPVIRRVYPGDLLPPLPWQVDSSANVTEYEMSAAFWRIHSFLFDRAIVRGVQENAPHWYGTTPSPFTLLTH